MKLGICMEKKNPPSFLNSHFITSSVFPVFLQQIRTGKIHTDYAPNDTLYTCFFPPNLHIIHAVVFEAVTGWEILKYFLSLTCTDFWGCVLERLLFTPRFLISGYKKKTQHIMCDFYCLPRYLFLLRNCQWCGLQLSVYMSSDCTFFVIMCCACHA